MVVIREVSDKIQGKACSIFQDPVNGSVCVCAPRKTHHIRVSNKQGTRSFTDCKHLEI